MNKEVMPYLILLYDNSHEGFTISFMAETSQVFVWSIMKKSCCLAV